MQKPKTQIKHDNLAAQIVVLKQELGVVNLELTNKITERNSLKTGLLSGRKELDKIKQQCLKETDSLLVLFKELNQKEQTLQERTDVISEKELALIDKIKVDKKKDKERKQLEVKLLVLKNKIEKDKMLIQTQENKIQELNSISKDVDKKMKISAQFTADKATEITKLDRDVKEKLDEFEQTMNSKSLELAAILERIYKEQEKVKQPLFSLRQEEIKLDRRKRNFDIMVMRFNKSFQAKYPNLQLKV